MKYYQYLLQPVEAGLLLVTLAVSAIGYFFAELDEGGLVVIIIGIALFFAFMILFYENWQKREKSAARIKKIQEENAKQSGYAQR